MLMCVPTDITCTNEIMQIKVIYSRNNRELKQLVFDRELYRLKILLWRTALN